MNDIKLDDLVYKGEPVGEPVKERKTIHLKIKPLEIDGEGVGTIQVWEKINQIVFVLNELNITIYEDDEEAIQKWKHFMEENK
jgi:hypothetical protein